MAKPDGVMWLVDEATRTSQGADFILGEPYLSLAPLKFLFTLFSVCAESLKKSKSPFCQNAANEFSIAHYTGKVTYNAQDLPEKNRDFVPPEVRSHHLQWQYSTNFKSMVLFFIKINYIKLAPRVIFR